MIPNSKFIHFGIVLLFITQYVNSNPRRLRVKTISNITADVTTTEPSATTLFNTETTTEIIPDSVTSTNVRAIRRRLRPTRPALTTTTEKLLFRTSTETSRINRGRVTWQKVSVGNVTEGKNITTDGNFKVTSGKLVDVTTRTPDRRRTSNFRNSQPIVEGDYQNVPNTQRDLIKPRRNATSIYNFETGKIDRRPNDLNVSTTNHIDQLNEEPDQKEASSEVPPRKYSSRYSRPETKETENEEQVLDSEDSASLEDTDNEEEEDTKGLLYNGDYREIGTEAPYDNEGAYNENIIDEKTEVDGGSESLKKGGKGGGGGGVKKSEKGGGEEHHADAKAVKGHKDQKAYKGKHNFHKGSKGFHDKEVHKGEYKDEKGSKKGHKEGGGHFESGHHGEEGKKDAEHAEKEEYKKGHSTRGGHVIHKKDEYEKKMEFFDESHEDGNGEKFGAFFESHAGKKGGHKKGGHKDSSSEGKHHGKKGHFAKGSHSFDNKGHDKKVGKEGKYGHHEKFAKKGSKKDNKSYHFDHGSGKPKGGGNGKKASLVAEIKGGKNQNYENEPKEDVEKENEELKLSEDSDDTNEEVEEESKEVPKVTKNENSLAEKSKNAEYMNEDGPTSYYTNRISKNPTDNNLQGYSTPTNKVYTNVGPVTTRKGKFMTEEELREDKETEKALQVFNPLHEDTEHGELSRGYRVAEPNVEDEPSHEESRPAISRVNIHSRSHPVQIVAMYKLPPIDNI